LYTPASDIDYIGIVEGIDMGIVGPEAADRQIAVAFAFFDVTERFDEFGVAVTQEGTQNLLLNIGNIALSNRRTKKCHRVEHFCR